ncbi:KaiB domain-containing protein [Xenococcus sp. PCC 7305]|uniref:circadian clock KaiB family protein n=1 Tax=Xenococcus sp. PCC 7305 TaxID=102125 RepID=UPI0002ACCE01|nr:circadian clock KaiB family protein [Xenococcus sp. PCC 7305]ELS01418.1 KaiB domain-containing protein [Xenococcus sp. PCC 7305]
MTYSNSSLPQFFKGIVLFTPGGDLVYGIDADKKARWHLHLCLALQEAFGLLEPPYFLLPGHTATIDRWQNQQTGEIEVCAEVYPAVTRYLPLLQVLFDTEVSWQVVPWREEYCNPAILETYRQEFPQLWEERDLIIRLDSDNPYRDVRNFAPDLVPLPSPKRARGSNQNDRGYVLRLFIASNNINTNQTLDHIHYILEKGLSTSYTLKIIDITKNPEQAEMNQVSATPTLIRTWPKPVKRIVGELTDVERIIKIISS